MDADFVAFRVVEATVHNSASVDAVRRFGTGTVVEIDDFPPDLNIFRGPF